MSGHKRGVRGGEEAARLFKFAAFQLVVSVAYSVYVTAEPFQTIGFFCAGFYLALALDNLPERRSSPPTWREAR